MGVIAFNPMLRAGYDVKLASGVITAGGTLGILIPPSVMIIVYAAVAGQSVVKLYAAAMFPGFFLAFLYLVYIIGWAMINPKIAPPLPEEQTRVPVPGWVRRVPGRLFAQHAGRRSPRRCSRPARATAIEAERQAAQPTGRCFKNFVHRAGAACCLTAGTLWLVWWYVVIHQQAVRRPAEAVEPALEQLGAPERRRRQRPPSRAVDRASMSGSPSSPRSWRLMLAPLLPAHERRALRGPEAPHLLGDAARHPHRRRAGGDPVRHHDGDRVGGGRRGRRLPARLPGPHARLEAHQGGGVPDRQDHRHGVLAVRRLGAVLGGVRDPRRPGAGRALGAVART